MLKNAIIRISAYISWFSVSYENYPYLICISSVSYPHPAPPDFRAGEKKFRAGEKSLRAAQEKTRRLQMLNTAFTTIKRVT